MITLLHGFTQTGASFDPLRLALSERGITSHALELPGHGGGEVAGDLWWGADRLAEAATPGVWLGYSMGARLALHFAIAHPELVTGLVLIGCTAGIDGARERAERRALDEALAVRIETVGVTAFLGEWLSNELFATLPDDPTRIRRRSTNTAAGLATSLRRWGTGTMEPPLWDRLAHIGAPTLVLAGSLDTKFTMLAVRLTAAIEAHATFAPIEAAGHAAHIERPETVADLVAAWLNRSPIQGRTASP